MLYLNKEKLYLSRHMAEHLDQRKSLVNLLVTKLTARLWQSPEQLPWAGLWPTPNSELYSWPHNWN